MVCPDMRFSLVCTGASVERDRSTKRGDISVVRLLCQLGGVDNIASLFFG